ncbi:sulfate adenylyltransferase [Conexibacter sp. W3-3-2]|uniref:sulfate adenylyltransferase subunit 1 n=1 Tax=Conexibacter sp. W3-3-2 TaxID=2675227 RepID=UPI0012B8324A|nr:GTP-binding protein [Conexibacter sp. W3-3-2]MTD46139.1 sulfate adenylyltransferase [Conexibacter sp. W3-3-2]
MTAPPPSQTDLANAGLLRLATAGSVDDGKSTLIGRLLYDSKAVLADQLEHVEEVSRKRGSDVPDLSLLTDGLRAEREQGITIDVAYRYFATARRTFILADTPGHVQYTRNMVTGASTADLAIVLIDARKGVIEQTKRHAYLSALLGIPHLAVAVNKMDLVEWREEVFDGIVRDFTELASRLHGVRETTFIPISALLGDNVVDRSEHTDWYTGPPLLEHLETVSLDEDRNLADARFPVQWVIRDGGSDYRGYAGQVASGVFRAGDEVTILPSGATTTIAAVETYDGPLDEAFAGMSVTIRLAEERDVSRGDMIVHSSSLPTVARTLEADVCWMGEQPLRPGARLAIKHTTASARVIVDAIESVVDVETLESRGAAAADPDDEFADVPQLELALNDIGRVRLRVSRELAVDPYAVNRATGAFILIDEGTNDTVAAGMIA